MHLPKKNLTESYVKLRAEAKSKRNRFGGTLYQANLDRETLLGNQEVRDVEIEMSTALPPRWVSMFDEVAEIITRIEEKITQLEKAQRKRLLKVFDDDRGEREMEQIAAAVADYFRRCETKVKEFASTRQVLSARELSAAENGQKMVAAQLSALSLKFRKCQQDYAAELRKRQGDASASTSAPSASSTPISDEDLLAMDQMELNVETRTQEIDKIAKSIVDLNTIFKELSVLVIDQGSMLDRIDYNMERVVEQSAEANVQLERAYQSAKSARASKCIVMLLACIFVLTIILILKHSG